MKEHKWIIDSGCSRHMSGKSSLFHDLKEQSTGTITLGDKGKCDIVGIGSVGSDSSHSIKDVYLVNGLKYKLLSVSQLCDNGNDVGFNKKRCLVRREDTALAQETRSCKPTYPTKACIQRACKRIT